MEMKSKNPFLKEDKFTKVTTADAEVYNAEGRPVNIIDYNDTMTVKGAVNKSFMLFFILLIGAFSTWWMAFQEINILVPTITGLVVGFIMAFAAMIVPQRSRYLATAYALFEGAFIGGISLLFELRYPGIVVQAVLGTFITFGVCLALYRFGIIKVTEQFKSIVIASVAAIATYYFISIMASWIFNIQFFHYGNSLMSIGFSVFVIIVAALSLFLDFDAIEQGARKRAPKFMEWYSAMGLIITLVWLYLEFLRLLSKLNSRN